MRTQTPTSTASATETVQVTISIDRATADRLARILDCQAAREEKSAIGWALTSAYEDAVGGLASTIAEAAEIAEMRTALAENCVRMAAAVRTAIR